MWKAYGKHDGGIAITTSLARLREAFKDQPASLFCGRIEYIDFETDTIPVENLFNAILRKRQSFQSENEVRLAYSDFGSVLNETPTEPTEGQLFVCPLDILIEDIWTSPTALNWFAGTVEAVCESAGFARKVRRSTLLDQPAPLPITYEELFGAPFSLIPAAKGAKASPPSREENYVS
jgi:hypothetical protein